MATPINPLALLEQAAADETLNPQQFVAPLRAAFQLSFAPNVNRASADLAPDLFREFLRSQQAQDIISRLGISPADFSGQVLQGATRQNQISRDVAAIRAANRSPEIQALRRELAVRSANQQAPLQTGGLGGGIPPLVPPVQAPAPGNAITPGATFSPPEPGPGNLAAPPRPSPTNNIQPGTNSIERGFGVPIPGLLSATRAGRQARLNQVTLPGVPRSPRSQTGFRRPF